MDVAAPISRVELAFSDGRLDLMKILAFSIMVLDHTNKWLLHDQFVWLTELGRVAFPLFALVFAYNLAVHLTRPRKFVSRTLLYGALAQWPFTLLVGHGMVGGTCVNILFVFLLAWAIRYLWACGSIGQVSSTVLFIIGSIAATSASFSWAGIAFVLFATALFSGGKFWHLAGLVVCAAALAPGAIWLAPLVVCLLGIFGGARFATYGPQSRLVRGHLLYSGYVLHLWALLGLQAALAT